MLVGAAAAATAGHGARHPLTTAEEAADRRASLSGLCRLDCVSQSIRVSAHVRSSIASPLRRVGVARAGPARRRLANDRAKRGACRARAVDGRERRRRRLIRPRPGRSPVAGARNGPVAIGTTVEVVAQIWEWIEASGT